MNLLRNPHLLQLVYVGDVLFFFALVTFLLYTLCGEACPFLFWRDVKYLIAKHAKKIDTTNSSWVTNASGFHHSTDYGFGLINSQSVINECQSDNFTLLDYQSWQFNGRLADDWFDCRECSALIAHCFTDFDIHCQYSTI